MATYRAGVRFPRNDCDDGAVSAPAPGASQALTRAVVETERHVAAAGWDQSPRLFALVRTAALLRDEPGLAGTLDDATRALATADAGHLTAVEQEGLAPTSSLESLLGRLAWPETVDGVAVAIERVVVPPDAERDMPDGEHEAMDWLAAHPAREDVRLVVGVLRGGERMCAIRQRSHDADTAVGVGPDLVPGLVSALQATLED